MHSVGVLCPAKGDERSEYPQAVLPRVHAARATLEWKSTPTECSSRHHQNLQPPLNRLLTNGQNKREFVSPAATLYVGSALSLRE